MNNTILWEEKNSIEQAKNLENKNELETQDITQNTEIKLKKNECENIGNKKEWKRTCPQCKREIIHKNKLSYRQSILHNKICYSCTHKGRITTKETKDKLKERLSGNKNYHFGKPGVNLGKKYTKEHCLKISLGRKGTKWNELSKQKILKLRGTEEYKEKCRNAAIKRMLKQRLDGNFNFRSYNIKACEYFDNLNKEKGWKLQHARNGGEIIVSGYFLDAYDKENNIVVEYDENYHYTLKNSNWVLRNKDVNRMNTIKNNLHCEFYRYNEVLKEIKKYE